MMNNGQSDKLRVVVASRDQEAISVLQAALADSEDFAVQTRPIVNGHADPLHGMSSCPDALVLVLSGAWQDELAALVERAPDNRPPLVAIAEAGDAQAMRMAMQAGARDFLIKPLDRQELNAALERIVAEARSEPRQARRQDSKVLALMNAKGGAGASLLAANLACRMATESGEEVGLIDLDLQFGSLSTYLDVAPERGLQEALEISSTLDEVAVGGFMARHETGVCLMAPTEGQTVLHRAPVGRETEHLLATLARRFRRVVADIPRWLDDASAAALTRADRVGIVAQQSVSHVRDATRLHRILTEELMLPAERLVLIVNRHDKNAAVTARDVEKALGMDDSVLIPNDFKTVNESVNYGKSLVQFARKAQITRSMERLEAALEGTRKTKPTGVFGRTLGNILRSHA
jgi:pilus assembly protein CpaE